MGVDKRLVHGAWVQLVVRQRCRPHTIHRGALRAELSRSARRKLGRVQRGKEALQVDRLGKKIWKTLIKKKLTTYYTVRKTYWHAERWQDDEQRRGEAERSLEVGRRVECGHESSRWQRGLGVLHRAVDGRLAAKWEDLSLVQTPTLDTQSFDHQSDREPSAQSSN